MSFQLRPYQQESVDRGLEFLQENALRARVKAIRKGSKVARRKNGLLVLPTGAGKSLVLANIALGLNAPSIITQPTREILDQNVAKFEAYGYRPAVYSASANRRQVGDVTLVTIGSVKSKAHLFPDVRYVLPDECHLINAKGGMYFDFFEELNDVTILGLTATPYRLSSDGYGGAMLKFLTRTRPKIFDEMVHIVQTGDLFRDGYLCPLEYHRIKGFDRNKVKSNSTGAEYDDRSVQQYLFEIGFADKLVNIVTRLMAVEPRRRSILVFTRFVDEARYLASQVPGVEVVTAESTPSERQRIIDGFRSGAIHCVANVGVLGIGFDHPPLDTIVLARPTMSLSVFYQQVGRGVRPEPGKPSCWIVDMVQSLDLFGKVEEMEIRAGGKRGQNWYVAAGEKTLTNVYLEERDHAHTVRY